MFYILKKIIERNFMKKVIFSTLFFSLFSSSLFASNTSVYIGATAGKVDSHSYTQFTLGQTTMYTLDSGILLGFGTSASYGEASSKSVTTLELDGRVGYEFIQDLRAYALGSGSAQFYDSHTYTGLGYGGALEYRLTNNTALEGSIKTTKMSRSGDSYRYNTSNIGVKFGF